jgi:predicted metal-dependent enzyme (double-stranded beta helix superfamily)
MNARKNRLIRRVALLGSLAIMTSAVAGCGAEDSSARAVPDQATRQDAELDDLDVLKVIPENYTLLLENEHVRVIEARIPPGTTEPPHRHLSGVSIAMTDYLIEHLQPNGEWTPSQQREPGTVYWSEGSVHQVRNVGTTYSHTIRIELKNLE